MIATFQGFSQPSDVAEQAVFLYPVRLEIWAWIARPEFSEESGVFVAVRIRMKKMGRKHRSYFRIVAIDHRQPRDGRVIEELGSYDPMIKDTDSRVQLKPSRIKYWMSVGALPSENVAIFIKKYMQKFEDLEKASAQAAHEAAAAPAPTPTA